MQVLWLRGKYYIVVKSVHCCQTCAELKCISGSFSESVFVKKLFRKLVTYFIRFTRMFYIIHNFMLKISSKVVDPLFCEHVLASNEVGSRIFPIKDCFASVLCGCLPSTNKVAKSHFVIKMKFLCACMRWCVCV